MSAHDTKPAGQAIQPPTAGPWRVTEHQTPGCARVIGVAAGDLAICKVDGGSSANPYVLAEARANAALIASAPDLLARAESAERERDSLLKVATEIAGAGCDLGDSERRIRLYAAITNAGGKL